MTIILRLIRFIVKSLTRFVRVSYNIDKSNIANTRHAVLSSNVKKIDVFRKGLKEYKFISNRYCSHCLKPIPTGSVGFIHSGYGTEEDITAYKQKLFLHGGCAGEIMGNQESLSVYVKTLRPSRDELEASLKAQMTLQDLLEDPKAIKHEGGCILWPTEANDLRSTIKVAGARMDRHKAAFLLAGNTYKTGNVIRHTCDVPHCFNPDHLIEGTQAENMADAVRRGRRNAGKDKLTIRKRAEHTLKERSERLRRYNNPDWFQGWDNDHTTKPE